LVGMKVFRLVVLFFERIRLTSKNCGLSRTNPTLSCPHWKLPTTRSMIGGYFARGTARAAHRLPTAAGHRTAGARFEHARSDNYGVGSPTD
jgi:hypothetical protein